MQTQQNSGGLNSITATHSGFDIEACGEPGVMICPFGASSCYKAAEGSISSTLGYHHAQRKTVKLRRLHTVREWRTDASESKMPRLTTTLAIQLHARSYSIRATHE